MRLVQRVETKYLVAGLWSCGDAKLEARQIVGLLGRNGDTVESLRELISVPLHVEALLRTFGREHPESQPGIERMLAYRRQVGKEFERLLREGAHRNRCTVAFLEDRPQKAKGLPTVSKPLELNVLLRFPQ